MKRDLFQRAPRRDGTALGFGVAFIAFGLLGLTRSVGLGVSCGWLYASVLGGLGAAGLLGLIVRER